MLSTVVCSGGLLWWCGELIRIQLVAELLSRRGPPAVSDRALTARGDLIWTGGVSDTRDSAGFALILRCDTAILSANCELRVFMLTFVLWRGDRGDSVGRRGLLLSEIVAVSLTRLRGSVRIGAGWSMTVPRRVSVGRLHRQAVTGGA